MSSIKSARPGFQQSARLPRGGPRARHCRRRVRRGARVHAQRGLPGRDLRPLVDLAAAHTGRERDEIVFELGVFTGETTFPRLYPAFYAEAGSARAFLLTVETRIHELVRATIPQAGPPQLAIAPREDGVTISYESPRRLCVLLRGLTEGTARHYGQHAEVGEETCMLRDDPTCTFEVVFSDGSPL